MKAYGILLKAVLLLCGCASSQEVTQRPGSRGDRNPGSPQEHSALIPDSGQAPSVQPVSFDALPEPASDKHPPEKKRIHADPSAEPARESPEEVPIPVYPPEDPTQQMSLPLESVIDSVYAAFPLLEAALQARTIAAGEQMAAAGEFDLKLKAASENGPTGFYRTFRQSVGLVQPLYGGGEAFAGYRIGRGDFEPWYLERQTNGAGEFKAGVLLPLSRDRSIDPRRAAVWRAAYGVQLAEPDILAQLIGFVQEASYAYWEWVAAGEKLWIAERVLYLAESRTARIERQVEAGFLDPPELTDNLRLVAERRAKRAEAVRKLQQSAVKLSLFYRDDAGDPLIPPPELLPRFPEPDTVDPQEVTYDMQLALQRRPEIHVLNLIQRQLEVDLAQAHNEFRPAVDMVLSGSQDMGLPTSAKNDKGQFELDASLFVDVPVQRRKARGKLQAIEGKISQLHAKRRMTEDKIVADVQSAYAALMAALEQVRQARQAVDYAEELAQRERRNFEEGASDLLKVTLREQYAVESAEKVVDALLIYFKARADYRAALAQDQIGY